MRSGATAMRLAASLALSTVLATALAAAEPAAPAFSVRAVQVLSSAPLPGDLPFELKPFGHETGFKIWFLVEGADIIGLDEKSLAITSLTAADGRDLAKQRNGKPTWKLDSFPKVSDDGRRAVFAIECSAEAFGQAESAKLAGRIGLLTGSERQEQELAFDPAKPSKAEVGKLALEFGAKGFGFGGGGDGYGIKISGPLATIASLEIVDGDKRIRSNGWSGSDGARTYQFEKPAGAAPKLAIAWWGRSAQVMVDLKR